MPAACYTGFSGSQFGIPNYQPKSNKGYFYVSIIIVGPSKRAVEWAQDNLRSTESVLDTTAMARRTDFAHKWRVLWLAEDVCLPVWCPDLPFALSRACRALCTLNATMPATSLPLMLVELSRLDLNTTVPAAMRSKALAQPICVRFPPASSSCIAHGSSPNFSC